MWPKQTKDAPAPTAAASQHDELLTASTDSAYPATAGSAPTFTETRSPAPSNTSASPGGTPTFKPATGTTHPRVNDSHPPGPLSRSLADHDLEYAAVVVRQGLHAANYTPTQQIAILAIAQAQLIHALGGLI